MQAVVFDFFGVIAQPRYISTTIAAYAKKDLAFVKPLYERYERGSLTRAAFWKKMGVKSYERIEEELAESFAVDPDFKTVHEVVKRTYATALLSNCDAHLLHVLLKRFGIENYFEAAVISGEVRMAKPDKKIYELLLKELRLNAEECVFIDDRLQNLETAKRLGFTTVFHLVEPETYAYEADYTIDELPQLLDVIEDLG